MVSWFTKKYYNGAQHASQKSTQTDKCNCRMTDFSEFLIEFLVKNKSFQLKLHYYQYLLILYNKLKNLNDQTEL